MKITVKNLPKSEVEITIEVAEKALAEAKAKALDLFRKEVKVDGFREGSVPDEKIIEKVGEKNIMLEANDIAIKLAYSEAVQKEKLRVIAAPKIEIVSQEPLKFTAKAPVLPEVKIGDWKKIKLKKEEVKVEAKEVAAVVKDMQKHNAEAKPVEGRAAKKGDRAEIDFAGFTPDGVSLDNTTSKNHPLVLGEKSFVPGFEEGVIGMKAGEEKEHTVKFPADYHAKLLAGKDVKFKIKLHKIEELHPPKLDAEFAKKITGGKIEKWEEVEKDIEKHLQQRKQNLAQQKLENDLITELLKVSEAEIPEAIIDQEVEFMIKDLQQRLSGGGVDWNKYLESTKKTEADIRKEMRTEAEKRAKVRLTLDKLVEAEKVEANEQDLEKMIEQEVGRYPESQKTQVRESFAPGSPNRFHLQHQMKIVKLLSDLTKTLSQ